MDVVGSEIGQKMRSAIKAKLTELGCYVDDELPDYVMVMVANKRTRIQMEDDLQLFLGDNTELFVNWLHQVLKKLQEVTVTAPINTPETAKSKERSKSKEKKSKDKKDKTKKSDVPKKSKKKEKEKSHRKKGEKKGHKSKKKSKHHEMIRPNIPPLLMNMEKESEPSITDVFAGQILKNHGIDLETVKLDAVVEKKPEVKRPILPIIDPATISQPETVSVEELGPEEPTPIDIQEPRTSVTSTGAPREEQIKEMNEIEAKIQGLKQKLAEQLDSMSDDEDFLNIRTEAEELMNDFVEDVFQEITQTQPPNTPPVSQKTSTPPQPTTQTIVPKPKVIPKETPKDPIEVLPQIELNLPKRPIRERLGAREAKKKAEEKQNNKPAESPERFTPEREPDFWPPGRSAKSRLGEAPEPHKRITVADDSSSDKAESISKRLTSKVSVLQNRPSRSTCASVVRVRPRPRVSTNSSLLLKAVADAHKSLLTIPPKVETEPQQVKRALVLPMRRCVEAQKIVIQVPGTNNHSDNNSDVLSMDADSDPDDKGSKVTGGDRDEYIPTSITKKIINSDYVPTRRLEDRLSRLEDSPLETINIHNTTVDKEKNTQFIVTMDGYHPNAFLAKKLMTEGLLDEEDELAKNKGKNETCMKTKESVNIAEDIMKDVEEKPKKVADVEPTEKPKGITAALQKKRLSDTSEESDTQVIIKNDDVKISEDKIVKRKSSDIVKEDSPPIKKRRASPIVFDVKKDKDRTRERTESASSDNNHVTVTTTSSSHKYDTLPPLNTAVAAAADRKAAAVRCRAFPLCRFGSSCAFTHPRCKFAAACTRRGCIYSHDALPARVTPPLAVASHVVPAANYKTISPAAVSSMCKYYPNCVNPTCHYYHPKPCRYGKTCLNKLECNFYHADVPAGKWRFPV